MPNPADLNASGHTVNDETSAALDPAEVEKAIEQASFCYQDYDASLHRLENHF